MATELTAVLAKFIVETQYDDFPASVQKMARKITLDTLAAIVAGTSAPGIETIRRLSVDWGGSPQSSILGTGVKVPAPQAAFVNAAAARARDFDEVHDGAVLHSAITALPVCLAVAEWQGGVSGKKLIEALVIGMEVIIRLGLSLTESPNVTGISSTWQMGVLGGCAAAVKLMGLKIEEIHNALGIAYSMTAGNQQAIIEGTKMVRVMQGITAQLGLTSAILAKAGIDGPKYALEGKFGYFPVYHQNKYDPGIITSGLGKIYEMENISLKPYPCCKAIHSSISGVEEILKLNQIDIKEVDSVEIKVNQAAFNLVCNPLESKRKPSTIPEAQFSLPYCLGVVLTKQAIFLDDFSAEAITNVEHLDNARKVHVVVDPEIEKTVGRKIGPAKIKLVTSKGSIFEIEKHDVKGQPQNPMTMEEIEEKFRRCCRFGASPLEENDILNILYHIKELENMKDVARIASSLYPKHRAENIDGSL